MKARCPVPPDAYARLRMLSNLAADRETPRDRPGLEPAPENATVAVEPAAAAPRVAATAVSRGD